MSVDLTPRKGESHEDRAALDVVGILNQLSHVVMGSDVCDLCGCLCQPWEVACPSCKPHLASD